VIPDQGLKQPLEWEMTITKQMRRWLTPEYDEQAPARLGAEGVTYASLSTEVGMTYGQLKIWHLELRAEGSVAVRAQSKDEAAALLQLRRDNRAGSSKGLGFFCPVGGETMTAKLAIHPLPDSGLQSITARGAAHARDHTIRFLCRVGASRGVGSTTGIVRPRNGRGYNRQLRHSSIASRTPVRARLDMTNKIAA